MNWLVATQPRCDRPAEVVEVRTFVVKAETEAGVCALLEQHQAGQMIRGMVPLPQQRAER